MEALAQSRSLSLIQEALEDVDEDSPLVRLMWFCINNMLKLALPYPLSNYAYLCWPMTDIHIQDMCHQLSWIWSRWDRTICRWQGSEGDKKTIHSIGNISSLHILKFTFNFALSFCDWKREKEEKIEGINVHVILSPDVWESKLFVFVVRKNSLLTEYVYGTL